MEAEFEREVLDRLIKIEGKLDGYNNAKIKTYENEKEILRIKSDLEDVQKTVADLTESNKWLFRTVVAAIIVAAIGLLTTIHQKGENNMNIEFIIENASKIILIVAAICTLISVITEFTKGVGFLDKIPTKFQVLILSLVICVIGFFAYLSYASIAFVWYYLVAVIFAAFIVAIVCCKGWDYLFEIWARFYRKKD